MLRIFKSRDGRLDGGDLTFVEGADPVWIDLLEASADEVKRVETELGIDIPTHDEMVEIELSDRLYSEDGAQFMTMTIVSNVDGEVPVKAPLTFILKGLTLVTVRHVESRPFTQYLARSQRGKTDSISGETVMLGLIEAIIDRVADALEHVGSGADSISREVFLEKMRPVSEKTHDLRSLITQIGRKGDLLTQVQESLVSVSRLAVYYSAVDRSASAASITRRKGRKDVRERVRLIQRDAASLGDHAVFLSGKIEFLLNATLGLINLEQNQIIKIFSVAAVVFLPPTLVASIYGMNFDLMPELHWKFGYAWAVGLMILSAIVPYLFFKRRGWL